MSDKTGDVSVLYILASQYGPDSGEKSNTRSQKQSGPVNCQYTSVFHELASNCFHMIKISQIRSLK